MKKGSQYLIGAVIIAGVVDIFMANRVYLKKKGVVLRDMVLTSLDETARGRGRSREKNAPQSEQDAQQSIWQADTPQSEQDAQQSAPQSEQDAQQNTPQSEQDVLKQNTQQAEQDAQQSAPQFEQDAQQNITPNPEDGKAARNSGRIVIE